MDLSSLEYSYTSTNGDTKCVADELMIANMISVVNNPSLMNLLTSEQQDLLCNAISNHVVLKSFRVTEKQKGYLRYLNSHQSKSR